jgi:protein ImuA
MPAGSALLDRRRAATALLASRKELQQGAALIVKPGLARLERSEKNFTRLLSSLPIHAAHEIGPAAPGDGTAAAGFAACLACLWARGPVVWAREAGIGAEEGALYPPGLFQNGLDLARVIVIDVKKRQDALWATEEALKIKGAVAICEIGPRGVPLELAPSRRLALSASGHKSTALIVPHLRGGAPSAAWSRWRIASAPSCAPNRELGRPRFSADLIRMRNSIGERRWVLEWNEDARSFTDVTQDRALGRDLAAESGDRPADPRARRAG